VALVMVAGITAAVVLTRDDDKAATTPRATSTAEPTPRRTVPFSDPVKPIGEPTQLLITEIGVDAKVMPVGTTAKGAQAVPNSLTETGWWKDGQQPGQPGNAVIVGHTASKDDGVFDDLSDLSSGDTITVKGRHGTLDYRVTSEKEIPVGDFAAESDRIYRDTGSSGLVLMTCGDWNGSRFETTVITYAKALGRR
jgi:LPXTG-site transpeptidase (sortase) family protein